MTSSPDSQIDKFFKNKIKMLSRISYISSLFFFFFFPVKASHRERERERKTSKNTSIATSHNNYRKFLLMKWIFFALVCHSKYFQWAFYFFLLYRLEHILGPVTSTTLLSIGINRQFSSSTLYWLYKLCVVFAQFNG